MATAQQPASAPKRRSTIRCIPPIHPVPAFRRGCAIAFAAMPRGDLFPEIGPFETGYLPLSGGHVMYWEQVGQPARPRRCCSCMADPAPAPARCIAASSTRDFWRIVIFDQRGAGRSRPLGSLDDNTTPDLVARHRDAAPPSRHRALAAVRRLLGLARWRWPTRRRIPERVRGCVLRGVFLGRPAEVDWFLHGLAAIFPDAHAAFVGFLPEDERGDLLGAYLRRLTDPDPAVHMPAARAWSVYEGSCSTLLPSPDTVTSLRAGPHRAGAGADRGALLRPRPVPAAGRPARRTWTASATSRPRSCRAATT